MLCLKWEKYNILKFKTRVSQFLRPTQQTVTQLQAAVGGGGVSRFRIGGENENVILFGLWAISAQLSILCFSLPHSPLLLPLASLCSRRAIMQKERIYFFFLDLESCECGNRGSSYAIGNKADADKNWYLLSCLVLSLSHMKPNIAIYSWRLAHSTHWCFPSHRGYHITGQVDCRCWLFFLWSQQADLKEIDTD